MLTQDQIEDNVLDYFTEQLADSPTEINRNTDIPNQYGLSPAQWAAYAPGLSNEKWMIGLGVEVESSEMDARHTAAQLAKLIFSRTQHPAAQITLAGAALMAAKLFKNPKQKPKKNKASHAGTIRKAKKAKRL